MDGTRQRAAAATDAFTAFYDASARDLLRYFLRATAGDRALAEDLTQETFVAAVRAAKDGHPDAMTWPWLIGVARHKLVDHHRRAFRTERKLGRAHAATPSASTVHHVQLSDETGVVAQLRALSPTHRLVLVLRYVDDLPVQEVADLIGRSLRATESIIVRARTALGLSLTEEVARG
ncbi:MAG: sigma-70 family polymerase sigma factor [Ilumatobacteraceae bacterium]|nr:sigma-70 family polymerase sigma factor [Ilumatobacteraceae bacterium]